MKFYNQQIGKIGEGIAVKHLRDKGFTILEKNFFTKWGEIDIIASKDNRLHFIEVKTRTNLTRGRPEEAVTKHKYQRAKRAVIIYLNQHHAQNTIYQIDVLAILYNTRERQAKIRFFKNILR